MPALGTSLKSQSSIRVSVAASLAGLIELLDDLDESISNLLSSLGLDGLSSSGLSVDSMIAAVRAVNDLLPREMKKPNGAFRQLQKHARFVQLYFDRQNLPYVRSNATALNKDRVRLRAEVAPVIAEVAAELPINVEELAAGPAKSCLREAMTNFRARTFGSAIVSAVNALEGFLRDLRRRRLKIEPQKGRLADVIDDLTNGEVLTKTEAHLTHVLRLYRNYSAHPSDFAPTSEDAGMVIQFVFAKVRYG